MTNKIKRNLVFFPCVLIICFCLISNNLIIADIVVESKFNYEEYAHKIAKTYLNYAFNQRAGLAQFDIDIITKKSGDHAVGADISTPCAQALCISLLDIMTSFSNDKIYDDYLKKAIRAFPKFRRHDGILVNYNLKTNKRQKIFNERCLWEWWGTPLATPEILTKLKKLIKTYEAIYKKYVIAIPISQTLCHIFKKDAFRPETEIHHTASIIQQYLYIYKITGRKKYITYAKNLIDTWWDIRNPERNLTVDWVRDEGVMDYNWDIVAYWPLLDAHINFYLITKDQEYLSRARAFAYALIRHAYQPDKRSFALAIQSDGKIMNKDGLNSNAIPEYDETQLAINLLRLYLLTGNSEYFNIARDVAEKWSDKFIFQEDIGMGVLWSTSAGRGFTIHLLLDMYLVTSEERWRDKAQRVANDLIKNYVTSEGFVKYDINSNLFWVESAYIDVSALLRLSDPKKDTYRSRISIPELMKKQ